MDIYRYIYEATRSELKAKQANITDLFPTFNKRVKAVNTKGGVKLKSIDKYKMNFKVHSGTEDDLWYNAEVFFKDLDKTITKAIKSGEVSSKDGKRVNYPKLARYVLDNGDIQIDDDCPATKYWGSAYILSRPKRDAYFNEPENRPPVVSEYIPAALGGTIKPAKKKREKTDGKKRKKD